MHALRPAASGGKPSRELITIYDKPKGLDSAVFGLEGVGSDAIRNALWGHEALVFRSKSAAPAYERKSMIHEIVRRMCSKKASIDRLIADPPPPLLPAATSVVPASSAEPKSSASYLIPLNLTQYVAVIDEAGGELPVDIADFTQAELIEEFGMKRLHAKKLRKWLNIHAGGAVKK